jgi:glycosyltransferase involved in cell wall biosynthesis
MTVIVHTPDVIGPRMAGPGIRALYLARELTKHFETILIAKRDGDAPAGVEILEQGSDDAKKALREADVLIGQPARAFRKRRLGQRIVFDLFDPTVLELRELYGASPSLRQRIHVTAEWYRLMRAMMSGDMLMSAALKQREFYRTVQDRDVPWINVPFGIDMNEVRTCEKPQDNVVVWGGGLWEWLDPQTAVDAVLRVNDEGVRAKLLFMGRTRPNKSVVDRRREDRFDELIARGKGNVSANGEWVPFAERLAWLRAGKVAIMLHRRTGEAEYSIRTRLFDAIAAGTPVVATAGGFAAELVESEGLGIVVPPGEVAAVAQAIRRLLADDDFHLSCVRNLERIRPSFAWEVVTRPLVDAIRQWQP